MSNANAVLAKPFIIRKSWEEFRSSSMLWCANRMLHLFGWAIVLNISDDGSVVEVYPARVRFRGFDAKTDERGFANVARFVRDNADELLEEAES